MKPLNSLQDVEQIIGDELVNLTSLSRENIINGLTSTGPELTKFITDTVLDSYSQEDVVVIFEVESRQSENNFTEYQTSAVLSTIAIRIKVTIYGNRSFDVTQKLKAKFESEKERSILNDKGLYLEQFSEIQTMNEFVNNLIYRRTDFSLECLCELSTNVDEFTTLDDFDSTLITM